MRFLHKIYGFSISFTIHSLIRTQVRPSAIYIIYTPCKQPASKDVDDDDSNQFMKRMKLCLLFCNKRFKPLCCIVLRAAKRTSFHFRQFRHRMATIDLMLSLAGWLTGWMTTRNNLIFLVMIFIIFISNHSHWDLLVWLSYVCNLGCGTYDK